MQSNEMMIYLIRNTVPDNILIALKSCLFDPFGKGLTRYKIYNLLYNLKQQIR
jgi:hypothetical protein